jgi:glyoxylate/hydroxypyruvate reductase A
MALLLTPLFAPVETWRQSFARAMPDIDIRIWPDAGNRDEIEIATIGRLPDNVLRSFPNLKLIVSLFAGQDMLMGDKTLPAGVPIVRAANPAGDAMMTEAALTHVLRHHRNLPDYQLAQQRGEWASFPRVRAQERKVGVLGLGIIGLAAARGLAANGFQVAGWVKRPRQIDGIEVFAGRDQLGAFLARSEIVVNLLPATAETDNILNRETLALLPKGASIVNLGRGQQIADADLIAALDRGHLSGATLDVFRQEPLPKDDPLWRHPRITVLPHASRRHDVRDIVPLICAQIARLRRGEKLIDMVDPAAGY